MRKIIFSLLCILSLRASAQITDTTSKKKLGDTIKKDLLTAPDTVRQLHSKAWTFIPPVALIGYGALSFAIHPVRRFDYYLAGEVKKTSPNFNTRAESYFLFTPIVMVYGLNMIGVEGKNRFIDRTALLGLSAGIFGITDLATKKFTHRLRPNGNDYLSFPSGHTGLAFVGAEFLAQEYSDKSPVYTVIGYASAVTTGIFRMYNRDHWFSDVVAGAGVGILSTKAAYLIYPYLRNTLTHTNQKTGRSTMIMPLYQDGVKGLSFAMKL